MFPDLKLRSVYYSHSGDIAAEFFIPVLKEAVKYDRVSAYFSAKSLASYAEGLEFFGKAGHCFRLILSKDISKEDYDEIKKGYSIKSSIPEAMLAELRQTLSLAEEKNISNLAYLISLGIVDIKIAFKTEGIFHDKCGILEDSNGNKICFRGSNNETAAALNQNYEAFNISCSWLDCGGFYTSGIRDCEKEFQLLWDNNKEGLMVLPAQQTIIKEILKFNKGKLIVDEALLAKDAFVLDYDEELKLWVNQHNASWFFQSSIYKVYLKSRITKYENGAILFKDGLSYLDFINIEQRLREQLSLKNYVFLTTQRYRDYIEFKNIHIAERRKLGIELKQDMQRYQDQLQVFQSIIDANMARKLREKQTRDAFFMLAMMKSGNFSVPGSGKTTSVLAVYCYLKQKELVDRILVIGPKNCFQSWRDEFNICFEGKEALKEFNVQDSSQLKTSNKKKNYLQYNYQSYNLLLFNYECLSSYEDILTNIVSKKTLLVFDEVHRIKRIGGDYARPALNIAKSSYYTIALTGTPIPNSYKDIYNFLHILFPDEYNLFFNFSESMLGNPSESEIEEINQKLQPFFCRTTKQQLSVPPANADILNTCQAANSEQELFDILCKKYRNQKFALLIRILQLETNPKLLLEKMNISEFSDMLDISDDLDEIDYCDYSENVKKCIDSIELTSKKELCINTVKALVESKKTVIVWCIFQDSIESLSREFTKIGISNRMIYGNMEPKERENSISVFKEGGYSVLITNPHTLAESVSLHNICHDAVYYEYSYNLVHLLQSKDRIHRLGLPEGQYTQYYYLQNWFNKNKLPFSLDEAIYRRLLEKEQTMLNAIDKDILEKMTTPEADVELIFKDLF